MAFYCLAKRKSPKRRRPCCACPFAALRATCDARAGGAPQNSLRAPFKQLRQVSARSACVLRHTHAPPALRFSARTEGNPTGSDIHSGHRYARPRTRRRFAPRLRGRAQQWPVWLLGCSAVPPLLAEPAAGRLRGGTRVGARVLRQLTRRGCPSGARSAKRVLRSTPQPTRRRFAPQRSEGVADWGSPFFCLLFFGEAKKSESPAGATTRPPPSTRACFPNQHSPASTSSARTVEKRLKTKKTIAASAC